MIAMGILASCIGKSTEKPGIDSTIDGNETMVEVEMEELPDTAYESVSLIKPTTTIIAEDIDGKIDRLVDPYRDTPGVFAFRKNIFRNAEMYGQVKGTPSDIQVDWVFKTDLDNRETGSSRSWGGGSGWTGQPVYVEWPDSILNRHRQKGYILDGFSGKEIIVGSLASNLYFIDFETGNASRKPIYVYNPVKGSVMLDPSMNGNIYVGQGIPNERPFGHVTVNLDSHSVTDHFGEDKTAPRHWGAYDSSAIRYGQFLFRPGENGQLYKFLVEPGKLKLHSTMSYTGPKMLGMEASMAIYGNYGYTADNNGYVVCTNLNTMKPVWVFNMDDDTDCTPVITVEEGVPYLYIGSEIDIKKSGESRFVKLNALNGSKVWELNLPGKRAEMTPTRHFDGGYYSSTLPGTGNCGELIFTTVVENLHGQNGKFIAIDKTTGKLKYEVPLKHYAWSSPVGFLNEKEEMFVLQADCSGNMYIIRGSDGEVLATKRVGSNFESSPVVSGNSAVVGSRGDKIYRVSLI